MTAEEFTLCDDKADLSGDEKGAIMEKMELDEGGTEQYGVSVLQGV
jgi:hypothetical protein